MINGGGSARPDLERQAAGLDNVRFVDMQPKERLPEVLAAADVHVVPLKTGLARSSVPSKMYSILAAGRPIVASVDPGTEVARTVEHGRGRAWRSPPDDAEALHQGDRGRWSTTRAERGGHGRRGPPVRRAVGVTGGGGRGLRGAVRRADRGQAGLRLRRGFEAVRQTHQLPCRPYGQGIVGQEGRTRVQRAGAKKVRRTAPAARVPARHRSHRHPGLGGHRGSPGIERVAAGRRGAGRSTGPLARRLRHLHVRLLSGPACRSPRTPPTTCSASTPTGTASSTSTRSSTRAAGKQRHPRSLPRPGAA